MNIIKWRSMTAYDAVGGWVRGLCKKNRPGVKNFCQWNPLLLGHFY